MRNDDEKMKSDPICGEESADCGQLKRRGRMSGGKVSVGSDQEHFLLFNIIIIIIYSTSSSS